MATDPTLTGPARSRSSYPLWHQALDAQSDLANWWRSRNGQRYGIAFLGSIQSKGSHYTGDVAMSEWGRLVNAPTYVLTEEMSTLVSVAAASMPDQPLLPTDLPTRSGFLYLPVPLYWKDINAKRVNCQVVVWDIIRQAGTSGILLTFYSDRWDFNDDGMVDLEDRLPGADIGTALLLLHIAPWAFGTNYSSVHDAMVEVGRQRRPDIPIEVLTEAIESDISMMRWLAAFWAMCRDYASVDEARPTNRQHVKRLRRTGVWEETPWVRVVTLRRLREHVEAADAGERRKLTHRFIVEGFWRDQWYSTLGPAYVNGRRNPESHRQKWIFPYVKGPEGTPLVTSTRVYRLAR